MAIKVKRKSGPFYGPLFSFPFYEVIKERGESKQVEDKYTVVIANGLKFNVTLNFFCRMNSCEFLFAK